MTPARWVTCLPMHVRANLSAAARALSDRQYVLGVLRVVISRTFDASAEEMQQAVMRIERGRRTPASTPSRGLQGLGALGEEALHPNAYSGDYDGFARAAASTLSSLGLDWADVVEQLGRDE